MKTFLLFLLIVIGLSKASAQQTANAERYALVVILYDDGYKIKIDSGQAPFTKKGPILMDSTEKHIKFVSYGAALNYMSSIGWKLHSVLADIDNVNSGQRIYIRTGYFYLFKKEY